MVHLRAFLFDFDGVLADTESLHWQGLREIAASLWKLQVPRSMYDQTLIGFDDRAALAWLADRAGVSLSPAQLQTLMDRKEEAIQARMASAHLLPGAAQVWHQACHAYRTAIVSGALRSEIMAILQYHSLPLPDVLVAAGDTPKGKPAPDPYLSGLTKLNQIVADNGEPPLFPAHCLVFEDTSAGIAAARAANMWTVRLASGAPPPPDAAAQPHLTLTDWQDVDLGDLAEKLAQLPSGQYHD